jgi:hypothetical protein
MACEKWRKGSYVEEGTHALIRKSFQISRGKGDVLAKGDVSFKRKSVSFKR